MAKTQPKNKTKAPKKNPEPKCPSIDSIKRMFGYLGNCDYEESRDCEVYGCDYICRCSKISNARVTNICLDGYDKLAKEILPHTTDPIFRYAVDRVFAVYRNPISNLGNWTVKVESGYYGDEIWGCILDDTILTKFYQALECVFQAKDPTSQMEAILKLEYGSILSKLKNSKYDVVEIDRQNIIASHTSHLVRVDQPTVERYVEQQKADPEMPIGVVIRDGEVYRLLDGYHRYTAADQLDRQKVWMVVAQPSS